MTLQHDSEQLMDTLRLPKLRWMHKTLIGVVILYVVVHGFLAFARLMRVSEFNIGKTTGQPVEPPPIPPLPAADSSSLLPMERDEFERIEARCVQLVRKVQPAVVGVLRPSRANLPRSKPHVGGGSGVIISADGLVLSQLHVSHYRAPAPLNFETHQPGEEAIVILEDGRECKAKLLGGNMAYDLSLLQITEPGTYPFVPLQAESRVRMGDWVVKIGHPMGFRQDRPAPVRLGRVLMSGPEAFVADCQAISGDSGGPYFDLEGRLVGIINEGNASLAVQLLGDDQGRIPEHLLGVVLFSVVSSPRIVTLFNPMQRGELSTAEMRRPADSLRGSEHLSAEQWTQGARIKAVFHPMTEPLRNCVVTILNGGVPIALGTVADGDGSIVAKASELPARPQCRLPDGTIADAEVVGVDRPFDLAVLRIPSTTVEPVPWADDEPSPAGTVAVAVGPDGEPLIVGVVSVAARNLADSQVPTYDLPLRASVSRPELHGKPSPEGGLTVQLVWGLAKSAGLKPGDRLLSIGDRTIQRDEDIMASVSNYMSGDTIPLVYVRGDEPTTVQLPLRAAGELTNSNFRSDNFPTALEYSPPVGDTACGGPLIDMSGRAIGITVGRSAQHAGWAIPGECVRRLVRDAKEGRLSKWPVP